MNLQKQTEEQLDFFKKTEPKSELDKIMNVILYSSLVGFGLTGIFKELNYIDTATAFIPFWGLGLNVWVVLWATKILKLKGEQK